MQVQEEKDDGGSKRPCESKDEDTAKKARVETDGRPVATPQRRIRHKSSTAALEAGGDTGVKGIVGLLWFLPIE